MTDRTERQEAAREIRQRLYQATNDICGAVADERVSMDGSSMVSSVRYRLAASPYDLLIRLEPRDAAGKPTGNFLRQWEGATISPPLLAELPDRVRVEAIGDTLILETPRDLLDEESMAAICSAIRGIVAKGRHGKGEDGKEKGE